MKTSATIFFVCLTLLILATGCSKSGSSAQPSAKLKASSITWNGHFGGRKGEPDNVYTLMTQGGFRAKTSKDFESMIQSWLAKHPNADVILVYTLDGMMRDKPDSKMKAVWLVDDDDNLNLDLVRQGGCPAGVMLLNNGDQTPLSREEYEAFARKVVAAEALAKKENLGIWSEPED